MSIIEAILIGLVQGLTEFLPVSSSGHTILMGKVLDVELSVGFELFIHLASLLAVLIVLRKSVFSIVKKPFSKQSRVLAVATIPTVIIAFAFKDFFESTFDGRYLAVCFLVTAILIFASSVRNSSLSHSSGDFSAGSGSAGSGSAGFSSKSGSGSRLPVCLGEKIGYLDGLIIGSVQGLAVLPGISRSGSTISTSVLLGASKTESARFSFLLSIPIILGSALFEFLGAFKSGGSLGVEFIPAVCGFLSAFVSGYFALKFMIKKLDKYFDYFAIYLLALSIFLFLDTLFLHWI